MAKKKRYSIKEMKQLARGRAHNVLPSLSNTQKTVRLQIHITAVEDGILHEDLVPEFKIKPLLKPDEDKLIQITDDIISYSQKWFDAVHELRSELSKDEENQFGCDDKLKALKKKFENEYGKDYEEKLHSEKLEILRRYTLCVDNYYDLETDSEEPEVFDRDEAGLIDKEQFKRIMSPNSLGNLGAELLCYSKEIPEEIRKNVKS